MKTTTMLFGMALAISASISMGDWDGRTPLATAQATFKIVDIEGLSVTNALVSVGFFHRDPEQSRRFEGYTDTNGCATLEGPSSGQLAYWISKDGYYESSGGYKKWMEVWRPPSSNIKNGRWQPWNPTFEVLLKQIKTPIPMYTKHAETEIPFLDKPIGFDLMKGDWVNPYGGGVRDDFVITFSRGKRSTNDFDLYITVGFSNEGDGIQEVHIENPLSSELRMPYEAPLSGYKTNRVSHAGQRPDTGYFGPLGSDETINYFYRIRTVLDENGKIKETYYGKVHGNFRVRSSLRENPKIIFTYYLNPVPNDRNVEFDPDKNLFGGRDRFAP